MTWTHDVTKLCTFSTPATAIIPISLTDNHMEKTMDRDMETGVTHGNVKISLYRLLFARYFRDYRKLPKGSPTQRVHVSI